MKNFVIGDSISIHYGEYLRNCARAGNTPGAPPNLPGTVLK